MRVIAAGTGLAVASAADNAALEASIEAVEHSGVDAADLALVFVTGDAHDRAHDILHAVRRVTGARAVVGCSGTGVLTEFREVEGQTAVAVLAVRSDRLLATPFLFEGQDERPELGAELARLGFAYDVVADDAVLTRARELAATLAGYPPQGLKAIKASLRRFGAAGDGEEWFRPAAVTGGQGAPPQRIGKA